MASVKKNFLYNAAYQLLVALAPIVTTPYLSRVIGAEGNGVFTYTQSITSYFVMVAMLGMSSYGVRAIAECGGDRARRSRVFWSAFVMNAVVGTLTLVAYVTYALTLGRGQLLLWCLWGMWVVGSVLDVTWLLFGMQEFRVPTVRNFVTRLSSIAFIFAFVRDGGDAWAYVAAIAGAYLVNSLLVWPFVGRYVDWARPALADVAAHLGPCLALFVPVLATSLYVQLDKIMLGTLSDMSQTGLYDYAEKVSKMPMSVITALGAVVLPKMSSVMAEGRLEEGKRIVETTMWFMLACSLGLSFGVAAVAPELCPVFLGKGYEGCVPLMRILCVIIPLICATNVMGVQWLLPTHRDRLFTLSVMAGAAVNIAVNLLTIPSHGALGASWATVAAELAVAIAQAWAVGGELDLRAYLRGALPFAIVGAAMFVAVRLFASLIGPLSLTAGGLATEVTLGAAFYLAGSYLWCWRNRNPRLRELLPRLARW